MGQRPGPILISRLHSVGRLGGGLPISALPLFCPSVPRVFIYSVVPEFQKRAQVLFKEKRLGVDVLDTIVVVCLPRHGSDLCRHGSCMVPEFRPQAPQRRPRTIPKKCFSMSSANSRGSSGSCRDGIEIETPLEKLNLKGHHHRPYR